MTVSGPAWPCRSSTNSSPPRRATVSVSAHRRRQALGHDLEQAVADIVAQGVVDVLEAIEVDEHHGEPRAVARRRVDRLLQAVVQQRAVGEPGERIVVGLLLDARLVDARSVMSSTVPS